METCCEASKSVCTYQYIQIMLEMYYNAINSQPKIAGYGPCLERQSVPNQTLTGQEKQLRRWTGRIRKRDSQVTRPQQDPLQQHPHQQHPLHPQHQKRSLKRMSLWERTRRMEEQGAVKMCLRNPPQIKAY